jgi:VanZ family protein
LWLSLTPQPPQIHHGLFGWDKLQHATAYGLLTLLAGRAFRFAPGQILRRQPWNCAFLVAICFGALLEILQGLMGLGRTAEFGDFLANSCGAGVVWLLARRLKIDRKIEDKQ